MVSLLRVKFKAHVLWTGVRFQKWESAVWKITLSSFKWNKIRLDTLLFVFPQFLFINKNWGNTNNSVWRRILFHLKLSIHTRGWREWKLPYQGYRCGPFCCVKSVRRAWAILVFIVNKGWALSCGLLGLIAANPHVANREHVHYWRCFPRGYSFKLLKVKDSRSVLCFL